MKDRKLLVCCLVWLMVFSASARQRTQESALDIARTAMCGKVLSSKGVVSNRVRQLVAVNSSAVLSRKDIHADHEAFFACVPQDGSKGYVLVSADDRMPAVLAVSEEGIFRADSLPENMVTYLEGYADALAAIEAGEATAEEAFYAPMLEEGDVVEPLLNDIKYNQGNPYNLLCPTLKSGNKPATGCVATAFAQLMRYWQWPQDYAKGYNSYVSKTTSDTIAINYDFSKVRFDWSNMLPAYSTKNTPYTAGETRTINEKDNRMAFSNIIYKSGYYLTVDSFICHSNDGIQGSAQLILTDDAGNFLQPVGDVKSLSLSKKGTYYRTYSMKFSMPAGYADGNYRFYVGTRLTGTEQWFYIRQTKTWSQWATPASHSEHYVAVTKKGGKFYLAGEEFVCEYTDDNAQAVAELMAACGASVNMMYGSSSAASTNKVPLAATEYFGYDKDAFYLSQSFCMPDEWHDILQEELKAKRPLLIRGTSDSGGGHAFIFDGYKPIGGVPYYHVNWGWGGSSDGYFLMTMLKPSEAGTGGSSSNYAHSNAIVKGFQPENGQDDGYALGGKGLSVADDVDMVIPGKSITATLTSIQNLGQDPFTGNVYIVLKDKDGKVWQKSSSCYGLSALKTGYYLTNSVTRTMEIPAGCPLGEYYLTVIAESSDNKPTRVYNPEVRAITLVAEDPATAIPGILRYNFNYDDMTAQVRRFSTNSIYNAAQYKGNIHIPDSVEYKGQVFAVNAISDSAFYKCTELTCLTMSNQVKSVGKYAFFDCTSLDTLQLSDSISTIDSYAFTGCGTHELVLPRGLTSLASKVFYENDSLKHVVFNEGLTTMGSECFSTCTALESVDIPSSLTKIPLKAFTKCTSLKTIYLPATVTNVLLSAFYQCTSMQGIYVGGTEPAQLANKAFDDTAECPIYVPVGSVDTYKASWSTYASRIQPDVTGIETPSVNMGKDGNKIVDLNGRHIEKSQMQKGHIYIVGNKKQVQP